MSSRIRSRGRVAGSASSFSNLYAAKFVAAASQYASITNAALGPYSDTKMALTCSLKRVVIGAEMGIMGQWSGGAAGRRVALLFNPSNQLQLLIRVSSLTYYQVVTTAAFTSTIDKLDIIASVDLANPTQADRMIIEVGGVRQAVSTLLPATDTETLLSVTTDFEVGRYNGTVYSDTIVDNPALWSVTVPVYSDLWGVGGTSKDFSEVAGLHEGWYLENNWDAILSALKALTPINAPTFVSSP